MGEFYSIPIFLGEFFNLQPTTPQFLSVFQEELTLNITAGITISALQMQIASHGNDPG